MPEAAISRRDLPRFSHAKSAIGALDFVANADFTITDWEISCDSDDDTRTNHQPIPPR